MRGASILAATLVTACVATGCNPARWISVSREGNITVGPPGAATASGGASRTDRIPPPERHVAHSAFDDWQPPPLGVLPPDGILRNSSTPVAMQAGALALLLRASDSLVPSWGGDFYLRIDLRAGLSNEHPPARDIAIVIDPSDRDSLVREKRLAASLFETLRPGDRGTIITTAAGQTLVPLVPFAGVPLLIERTRRIERADANTISLADALEQAVTLLGAGRQEDARMRRLIVLSGNRALIDAESRDWINAATEGHIEVSLVPFTRSASERFERLQLTTQAMALPVPENDDAHEHETITELSALPDMPVLAQNVLVSIDSLPGPTHLIEAAGAQAVWTPEGGEVPLGDVRAGEDRTFVLRGLVPSWRQGSPYEIALRVRWQDEHGAHHQSVSFTAQYSGSPEEYAESRHGDVLQYVSLLNTLSTVQAALTRDDRVMFQTLQRPALIQSRSLMAYAAEHHDEIMGAQAALLETLLRSAPTTWWARAD